MKSPLIRPGRFLAGLVAVAASVAMADAAAQVWSVHWHACPGANRTDALHRDVNGRLWVGCGTNATGYGLFHSDNGGATWRAAAVQPANAFAQFRVNSISRGHDGSLQVAGFEAGTRNMVMRVDTATTPFTVTPTLTGVATAGFQFHVGSYRELGDGRAIAEALNGNDLLYRPTAATGANASLWTAAGFNVQVLDLVVHGDRFYGSGSRNIEPPRVFLPPTSAGSPPHQLQALDLQPSGGWRGELWALAVNGGRLVAVGVDQDDAIGKIFVSGSDPGVAAAYTEHSISAITGDTRSWARGVCKAGSRIVVVGERQPLASGGGRVLLSDDGGARFSAITPAGVSNSVTRCVIEPDGTIVVAGAAGFIGVRSDPDWIFRDEFERP